MSSSSSETVDLSVIVPVCLLGRLQGPVLACPAADESVAPGTGIRRRPASAGRSTPSLTRGPLPAVNEQCEQLVYHVVIQRPATTRLVGAPVESRLLDLEEAIRCVRLCDVDYQVVGEQQFCQRVGSIGAKRPVRLTIQAIIHREVGVHPSTIDTTIVLAHVEGVFEVVEVAHLQVAVDLIKLLQLQDYVLDLGAADPLDADRELAGDYRLADHS